MSKAALSHQTHFLDLSTPQVMGILNITPNSFSSVGRFTELDAILSHAERIIAEGAAIIDVGGEPTNPGVHPVVSLQEELDRVIPVVEALSQRFSVPISVDTSKPEVIREAIRAGAALINDVRGLRNPGALQSVAESKVAVCLMHMSYPNGKVAGEEICLGDDPVPLVRDFLQSRIDACLAAGISKDRILIDPGIGHGNFGKNLAQNLSLLRHLDQFTMLGVPILVGVSRKTFIGEILNLPVEERLYGSLAAAALAVTNGAAIIRAHDVRATVEVVRVVRAIKYPPS